LDLLLAGRAQVNRDTKIYGVQELGYKSWGAQVNRDTKIYGVQELGVRELGHAFGGRPEPHRALVRIAPLTFFEPR